jgi:DNA-binding protein
MKAEAKILNPAKRFKRAPLRRIPRITDIYVRRKRPVQSYLQRVRSLFENHKETCVTIHGLGAALLSAIEVALSVKHFYKNDQLKLETTTSTVTLIDDIEFTNDEEPCVEKRRNNAIHIKLHYMKKPHVPINKDAINCLNAKKTH